jgi:asparagine synthase (glutamine-hydrolysing)
MLRFISIHWNQRAGDSDKSIALVKSRILRMLPKWTLALDLPGLLAYCSETTSKADIHRLSEGTGLVLGSVFRRPKQPTAEPLDPVHEFGADESGRVQATLGEELVSSFWGSYIALIQTADLAASCVLRSPLGRVKCFHANALGLHFFFSHLEDYCALSTSSFTVNWDCIRAQAACSDYLGRQTAINEITWVEGGECVVVSNGGVTRSFYWNPCEIASEASFSTFEEAATVLRTTTQMCVQSWAAHFGTIVQRLSGGLDSSITVSCARRALPRSAVTCLNYFTPDALGDERRFARAVANQLDVELIEHERQSTVDLSIFTRCGKTAWPVLDFHGYGHYQLEVDLARRYGASAIFCGELGDNLFEQGAGYQAAADYVWRHGIRPGLLTVAVDCALRRNVSVWSVLRRAVSDSFRRSSRTRWSSHRFLERELGLRVSDLTLLRKEALDSVHQASDMFIHPWLQSVDEVPPAKFLMIYGIRGFSAYDPPFAALGDTPIVAPLASQPLAEACLQIPTYFNNRGALNRSVARRAFANDLPSSVLQRITKSTPEPWTRDVVRKNQTFLRSFLLDGLLVQEGILDPKRVETVLSADVRPSQIVVSDLIVQLYVEGWLRRWQVKRSSLAA